MVNVFGEPVTGNDGMERAIKAYEHPDAGRKQADAMSYVKKHKDNWGHGVATLVMIYNATGEVLNIIEGTNSKYGRFLEAPPAQIQNGQWGAFLHVKNGDMPVSEGSVTYKVNIKDTGDYSYDLLGWITSSSKHTIHCDIFDANVDPPSPDEVFRMMETQPQADANKIGMRIIAKIEGGTSRYTLTRDDVGA